MSRRLVPGRTTVLTLLVASLVLLSGCAGLLGDDDSESTPEVDDGADDESGSDTDNGGEDADNSMENGDSESGQTDSSDDIDSGDQSADDGDNTDSENDNQTGQTGDDESNEEDNSDSNTDQTGDDTDPSANTARLDAVPAYTDDIIFLDGNLFTHQTTPILAQGSVELNDDADSINDVDAFDEIEAIEDGDTYADALQKLEENDVDISKFNSMTMFGSDTEEGPVGTQQSDFGAIIDTDWTWDDLVRATETNLGEQFQETRTYGGADIYINGSNGPGPATWLADIGDGTYILGQSRSVTAAIDTLNGDSPAVGGVLRDTYTEIGDGFMKIAVDVRDTNNQQFGKTSVVTMRHTAEGERINFGVNIEMGTQQEATQFAETMQFLVVRANSGEDTESEEVQQAREKLTDSITIGTDGRTMTMDFEMDANEFISVLQKLDQNTGMGS